jgi:hypothetical protein
LKWRAWQGGGKRERLSGEGRASDGGNLICMICEKDVYLQSQTTAETDIND